MAKQTINIGSSVNKGDGDPLRTAFDKINDNFDEVYADIAALEDGNVVTDIKGNVFGDDSTLLVDAVNNKIVGTVETASLTVSSTNVAIGLSAGITSQGTAGVAIGEKAGETNQGDQAIAIGRNAGYANQAANSIVINATGTEVYNFGASSLVITPIRSATMTTILGYDADTGEVTHNAAIPGYISLADLKTEVAAATDFADFKARIAAL